VTDLVFKEESFQIVGACYEVYRQKGCGFLEPVYQECLAIEFGLQKIPFIEQPSLKIDYKGTFLKKGYEPDFVCFGKIIVEIKSVTKLLDEHRAQIINYLKSTGMQLGLLVNFGHHPKIEIERFVNLPGSRLRTEG
jgi:GxxExxY protein